MHTEFQGPLISPQFYDFWVISWQISQIYLSQKLTSFVEFTKEVKQIEEKKAGHYFFTLKFHAVNSTNTYWGKKR